jgi:hypothetical protein
MPGDVFSRNSWALLSLRHCLSASYCLILITNPRGRYWVLPTLQKRKPRLMNVIQLESTRVRIRTGQLAECVLLAPLLEALREARTSQQTQLLPKPMPSLAPRPGFLPHHGHTERTQSVGHIRQSPGPQSSAAQVSFALRCPQCGLSWRRDEVWPFPLPLLISHFVAG